MPKCDFKFRTEFRVRWMECDAQGIVFNGAYLGYLEVAQAEYYRNLGVGIYHIPSSGYFDLAVVKTTIEFKAPARVDEIIEAYVRVSRIGNTSLNMDMELYRPNPELLLTTVQAVYVGYNAATEATRRGPRRPSRVDRPLRADRRSLAPFPLPGAGRGDGKDALTLTPTVSRASMKTGSRRSRRDSGEGVENIENVDGNRRRA